jgi:hypothetical protein
VGNERHTSIDESGLCYLQADNVELPAGTLAGLRLCSPDDQSLGALDGVLIEPSTRRVRYFVVKRAGWLRSSRFLLPLETPAHVDRERNLLRVEVSADDLPRENFDADTVRPFSDEDVVTAMFAPNAA